MRPVTVQGLGTIFEVDEDTPQEEVDQKVKEYLTSRPSGLPRVESPPPSTQEPGLLDTILSAGSEIAGGVAGAAGATPLGRGAAVAAKGIPYVGRGVAKIAPMLLRALGMGAGAGVARTGSELLQGESPNTAVERGVEGAGRGVAGEAVFGGANAVARGVGRLARLGPVGLLPKGYLKESVTPEGQEMVQKLGFGAVRPGQVTGGTGRASFVEILDSAAEGSFTGGGIIKQFESPTGPQGKGIQALVDDLVGSFKKIGTREQALEATLDALEGGNEAFRAGGARLAGELDALAPSVGVSMAPLKAEATKRLGLLTDLPEQAADREGKLIFEKIMELPDTISFKTAHMLRSWLSSTGAKGVSQTRELPKGVARFVAGGVEREMESAAAQLNPEVLDLYKRFKNFWREGSRVYNAKFVRKMLNDTEFPPEAVVNEVVKPGGITRLRLFRKAVGADGMEPLQATFVQDMLEKAADPKTGEVSGGALLTQLKRYGDPLMKELAGETRLAEWKSLARIIDTIQQKGSSANIFIKLKQAGAVQQGVTGLSTILGFGGGGASGAAIGGAVGAGTMYLYGPRVLAKGFTNEKVTRHLLEGLQAPRGSRKAVDALGRAASILSLYELQEGGREDAEAGYTPGP